MFAACLLALPEGTHTMISSGVLKVRDFLRMSAADIR